LGFANASMPFRKTAKERLVEQDQAHDQCGRTSNNMREECDGVRAKEVRFPSQQKVGLKVGRKIVRKVPENDHDRFADDQRDKNSQDTHTFIVANRVRDPKVARRSPPFLRAVC